MSKEDSQFPDSDHWVEGDLIHCGRTQVEKQGLVGRKCTDWGAQKVEGLELQTGNWARVRTWASSAPSSLCFFCFPDANTLQGPDTQLSASLPFSLPASGTCWAPQVSWGLSSERHTLKLTEWFQGLLLLHERPQNKLLLSLMAAGNSLPLTQLNASCQNRTDREETGKWEQEAGDKATASPVCGHDLAQPHPWLGRAVYRDLAQP